MMRKGGKRTVNRYELIGVALLAGIDAVLGGVAGYLLHMLIAQFHPHIKRKEAER